MFVNCESMGAFSDSADTFLLQTPVDGLLSPVVLEEQANEEVESR